MILFLKDYFQERGIGKLSGAGKAAFVLVEPMIEGAADLVFHHSQAYIFLRINWSGMALSTFYASIRKALIVVIVARALGILFGLGFATWWIFGR